MEHPTPRFLVGHLTNWQTPFDAVTVHSDPTTVLTATINGSDYRVVGTATGYLVTTGDRSFLTDHNLRYLRWV